MSDYTTEEREMLAARVKDDNGVKLDASVAPTTSEQLHAYVRELVRAQREQDASDVEQVRAAVERAKTGPVDK